jgi:hypothetical protein
MRYAPFVLVSLIGIALGIAGVIELGVGAAYGGVMLAGLSATAAYADHLRREDPRSR